MVLDVRLPPLVGALGLAAVFSAEISAVGRRAVHAHDVALAGFLQAVRQSLGVRRPTCCRSPAGRRSSAARLGTRSRSCSAASSNALTIFYTLLGVILFVPIVAGLYVRRTTAHGALATMVAGVGAAVAVHVADRRPGLGHVTPAHRRAAGCGRVGYKLSGRSTLERRFPGPPRRAEDARRSRTGLIHVDDKTYKIAVIAGDGIGKEVIPAGIAALEAATSGSRRLAVVHRPSVGLRVLSQARPDARRRRVRSARQVRRDLSRRHRRADRARSHLGRRSDAAAAQALQPVRQPAADAAAVRPQLAAGQPHRRRHRHDLRSREHRGRVRRRRRTRCTWARRTKSRSRPASSRIRHRAHRPLRLRDRGQTARARCWRTRPSPTRCGIRWCCGTRSPKRSRRNIRP